MMKHEEMRGLLPLAAADALEPKESAVLEAHLMECEECRRQLEVLRLYSAALREIAAPELPAGLLERTSARLHAEQTNAVPTWLLVLLALFSWATGLAFWWIVRVASSGVLSVFGANLTDAFTWSALSTLLVWATAGTVAVVLGREGMRKVL
jgi:anti-sigma factor RsiW